MLAQEDRSMLAKLGFFLCRDGEVSEAFQIFTGLAAYSPEKDGPVAGLALCQIIMGECEAAIVILEERLARGSAIAGVLMLYKMLALGMSGKMEEAGALRQRMQDDGMVDAARTADKLLEDLGTLRS